MLKPKVVVATPFSGRYIPPQWHVAMTALQYPNNTNHVNICTIYRNMEDAFNELAQTSLDLDGEFTLFVDDDTQMPLNVVIELLKVIENADNDVMVAGGIYTTRSNPPMPLVFQGAGLGYFWKWKFGEVFPCWALGSGCMMVRNEVFKAMPKPWFKDITEVHQLREFPDLFAEELEQGIASVKVSVDLFFFRKLEKAGYKVLAHGGLMPIHWGEDGRPYWFPGDIYPTRGIEPPPNSIGWWTPAADHRRGMSVSPS